ncbi:hypothetical protein BOX15_Mlig002485g2 [Macrostomum lignano]|uniref:Mab-21-like HhH/H2TH-like domain-containing protein n=1 Tax=Macrostomum lignano TaxID=282301 RepID=A0A267F9Y0_9PLAT|nr:hypothetical protein BOX15_Mlig002485g2 [Macrostomum lignano]
MTEECLGNHHSSLMLAALRGNVSQIVQLKNCTDVDLPIDIDGRPYTALHAAASHGHLAAVTALLEAQADANGGVSASTGCRYPTPIYWAAMGGHEATVEALLLAQADPDLPDQDGQTPLYVAVTFRHLSVVKLLISAQANVNFKDDVETTALHLAVSRGYTEIVAAISGSNQVNSDQKQIQGASALHFAAQMGELFIALSLIRLSGADVNLESDVGATPLFLAAQDNHCELIDALTFFLADPDLSRNGQSPIYSAAKFGHSRAVDRLLRAQADVRHVTRYSTTPLYIAAQNGRKDILTALIKAGANTDDQQKQGASALYIACQKGHAAIVDVLIKAQANPDLQAAEGETALFVASQNGHNGIVNKLISVPAALDLQRISGLTAMGIASQNGHFTTVQMLIKATADVNGGSNQANSAPLRLASEFNHIEIVQALLDARADVNLARHSSSSAVYSAAFIGHSDIVRILVKSGADITIDSPESFSPVHAAVAGGQWRILHVLRELGVQISVETCEFLRGLALVLCLADSETVNRELTQMTFLEIDSEIKSPIIPSRSNQSFRNPSQTEHPDASTLVLNQSAQSLQLHSKLSAAGFTEQRASLQGAAADVLEHILRLRTSYDDIFIVGSYSETWGNNLVCVDGRTDSESDIDITRFVQGRPLHLKGICKCPLAETDSTVEYVAGHIIFPGYSANPAEPMFGSMIRPAVDRVSAFRLCCYPPIGPLQLHRVAKSNIPNAVLQLLTRDISTFPCHVVHAAPQGQAGNQLRVSTTFLERRLMRSLSTLQGQLFVALKFLVKKIIGRRVHGLKAYHAKTITFRMVEETPAEQWTPQNLFDLLQRSLNMLLNSVQSSYGQDYDDGRIMEHFFLSDAHLYLKGADRSTAQEVANVLREVIDELPELLTKFMKTLIPVSSAGLFYFHPFLIRATASHRCSVGVPSGKIATARNLHCSAAVRAASITEGQRFHRLASRKAARLLQVGQRVPESFGFP